MWLFLGLLRTTKGRVLIILVSHKMSNLLYIKRNMDVNGINAYVEILISVSCLIGIFS